MNETNKNRFEGNEGQEFARKHLVQVVVDDVNWVVLHRNPITDEYWRESFPQSELHGGGPPVFEKITKEEAKREFKIDLQLNFLLVDPIISTWAAENSLNVQTVYQDSAVRSVEIVGTAGRKAQIWIDSPAGKQVSVHVWDYKKRRRDWTGSLQNLTGYLTDALTIARTWTSE